MCEWYFGFHMTTRWPNDLLSTLGHLWELEGALLKLLGQNPYPGHMITCMTGGFISHPAYCHPTSFHKLHFYCGQFILSLSWFLTNYSFIFSDKSGLQVIIRSLCWSGEKSGLKNSPYEKLYDSSAEDLSGVFQQSPEAGFLFQRLTSFWILVPSEYCQLLLTKRSRPNFRTSRTSWKTVMMSWVLMAGKKAFLMLFPSEWA